MMRYYEKQVRKISGQYLDHKFPSTSFSNDTTKQANVECGETSMSPSGYFVKYNPERNRWYIAGNNIIYHYPRLFHPLKYEPIENKWIRTLTTYLFNQGWYEAEIGFRCTRRDKKGWLIRFFQMPSKSLLPRQQM
jgi:hypothetical protein